MKNIQNLMIGKYFELFLYLSYTTATIHRNKAQRTEHWLQATIGLTENAKWTTTKIPFIIEAFLFLRFKEL